MILKLLLKSFQEALLAEELNQLLLLLYEDGILTLQVADLSLLGGLEHSVEQLVSVGAVFDVLRKHEANHLKQLT